MAVHPLTYAYLSGRYTLTYIPPVCCRRALYQARVHPSALDPSWPGRAGLRIDSRNVPRLRSRVRLWGIPCGHRKQS